MPCWAMQYPECNLLLLNPAACNWLCYHLRKRNHWLHVLPVRRDHLHAAVDW